MDKKILDKYFMTDARESEIWQKCVFVFDTSALLNFYNYSPDTKKFLFTNVFSLLKDRLWIPNHVEFEYLKNRNSTLKNPISEKYGKLTNEEISSMIDLSKKFENQFENLKNKTKKKFAHPYLSETIFKSFDQAHKKQLSELSKLIKLIESEIEDRKKDILALEKDDDVLKAIEDNFTSGKAYTFKQLIAIAKEGEFRYAHKIPPGYEDLNGKNNKDGLQAFGDLIIWKQILEYARITTKPLVFITDDVKSDWCYVEKQGSDTRITRPKEELIKEIYDFANVDFWMYTLSQFVYNIEKYLSLKPNHDVIEDIELNAIKVNIEYDKFYAHLQGEKSYYCFRFFDDGEVIFVFLGANIRVPDVQRSVRKWFNKGYEVKGKYTIFEDTIEINIQGMPKINLKGKIINTELHLTGKVEYGFREGKDQSMIFKLITEES